MQVVDVFDEELLSVISKKKHQYVLYLLKLAEEASIHITGFDSFKICSRNHSGDACSIIGMSIACLEEGLGGCSGHLPLNV